MFRCNSFNRGGEPPVIPIEPEVWQRVIDFLQVAARGTVASVPVHHEDALEAVPIRRADDVLHSGAERGSTQAQGARIGQEVGRDAEVQRWGNQYTRGLRG